MKNMNKKICYITTISGTLELFVLPTVKHIMEEMGWTITLICNDDLRFVERSLRKINYISVQMKRGISLGGILSMFKLVKISSKEKFDLDKFCIDKKANEESPSVKNGYSV